MDGTTSLYIIPVSSIVGPAAVVPNIFREYRYNEDNEKWLAVLPYRKWGKLFTELINKN